MSAVNSGVATKVSTRLRESRLSGKAAIFRSQARSLDETFTRVVQPLTIPALRVLLGTVFVWFGLLKVLNASPVTELIVRTLPWFPRDLTVPALGGLEMVLGAALVAGICQRIVIPVLVGHLAGTFLTFVMVPALMFRQDNPFLLTDDGEFVVKNLVLISAGLVLLTHAPRSSGTRAAA